MNFVSHVPSTYYASMYIMGISFHYKGHYTYTAGTDDASNGHNFGSDFGTHLPTLPSGVSAHYKYKAFRVTAVTASDAQYILGADTKASGNSAPVPYRQIREGYVDNPTQG